MVRIIRITDEGFTFIRRYKKYLQMLQQILDDQQKAKALTVEDIDQRTEEYNPDTFAELSEEGLIEFIDIPQE